MVQRRQDGSVDFNRGWVYCITISTEVSDIVNTRLEQYVYILENLKSLLFTSQQLPLTDVTMGQASTSIILRAINVIIVAVFIVDTTSQYSDLL